MPLAARGSLISKHLVACDVLSGDRDDLISFSVIRRCLMLDCLWDSWGIFIRKSWFNRFKFTSSVQREVSEVCVNAVRCSAYSMLLYNANFAVRFQIRTAMDHTLEVLRFCFTTLYHSSNGDPQLFIVLHVKNLLLISKKKMNRTVNEPQQKLRINIQIWLNARQQRSILHISSF